MDQSLKNKIQLASVMSMIGGELNEKAAPRGSKYAAEDSLYDARDEMFYKSDSLMNEVRNEQVRQYYNEQMKYNNFGYVTPEYVRPQSQPQQVQPQIEENGPVQMELPLFEGEKNNITINTDKLEALIKENTEVVNKINKLITSVLIEISNNISENNELLKQVVTLVNDISYKDNEAVSDTLSDDVIDTEYNENQWIYGGDKEGVSEQSDTNNIEVNEEKEG